MQGLLYMMILVNPVIFFNRNSIKINLIMNCIIISENKHNNNNNMN